MHRRGKQNYRVGGSRERRSIDVLVTGATGYTGSGVSEAASRAGGASGSIEDWSLDEALEDLGDHAYALALNQRLSNAKARRILG